MYRAVMIVNFMGRLIVSETIVIHDNIVWRGYPASVDACV